MKHYLGIIIIAILLIALSTWVILWAVNWYESAGNAKNFTPGDLGSALNIAVAFGTIASLVAILHFSIKESKHRELLQLSDTLTTAIQDFGKRCRPTERENDRSTESSARKIEQNAFSLFYAELLSYLPSSDSDAATKRYLFAKEANYALKPLAYWCKWVATQNSRLERSDAAGLRFLALRMLSALRSQHHVYLIVADELRLESVSVRFEGRVRSVKDHAPIIEFIKKYAADELGATREANLAGMRQFRQFIDDTNWHNDKDVRNGLFAPIEPEERSPAV